MSKWRRNEEDLQLRLRVFAPKILKILTHCGGLRETGRMAQSKTTFRMSLPDHSGVRLGKRLGSQERRDFCQNRRGDGIEGTVHRPVLGL